MDVDVRVRGVEQLEHIARRLRESGDKDLRRELYRGINRAVKPIKADIKATGPGYMPSGYRDTFATSLQLRSATRGGGRNPGVRITAKAKGRPRLRRVGALDKGVLRHPLYGNRNHWYTTAIRPGWFTDPARRGADTARRDIVQALEVVAERLAHG